MFTGRSCDLWRALGITRRLYAAAFFQGPDAAFLMRAETVVKRRGRAGERSLISVRLLQVLLAAALLGGCTFFFDVQDSVQSDPEPDTRQQQVIFDSVLRIMQSMKEIGSPEISNLGPNEAQSGPEKWTVCSRGSSGAQLRYFTFFLKGETVANWRPAVINDRCESRNFSPFEKTR
jgi:hypothetical protein